MRYLIIVRRCNIFRGENEDKYKIDVYDYTGDVFHAMGEIEYRSEVKIDRITFSEWSITKVNFWTDHGIKIRKWNNKY